MLMIAMHGEELGPEGLEPLVAGGRNREKLL